MLVKATVSFASAIESLPRPGSRSVKWCSIYPDFTIPAFGSGQLGRDRMADRKRLDGRVALITGGGRGIGRAMP